MALDSGLRGPTADQFIRVDTDLWVLLYFVRMLETYSKTSSSRSYNLYGVNPAFNVDLFISQYHVFKIR